MTREESAGRQIVFQYARDRFGSEPEYLWLSSPDAAVLRRRDNAKWYAIVMRVPRQKLGLPVEGEADVLDVKCDPLVIGSLLALPGFLPAWHMNKRHWISVLLEGEIPPEQIQELLDYSFALAASRRGRPADAENSVHP